jgi:hypothetical protein
MTAFDEEIVFAPSEDQRWRAGVLMRPSADTRRSVGVVCLHGASAFFYAPTYIALGRALAAHGYPRWDGRWPHTATRSSAAIPAGTTSATSTCRGR